MLPSLPIVESSTAARNNDAVQPAVIQEGSLVIVYENVNSMKAVTVSSKGQFQNRFGAFSMKDWIGKPYGSKVYARAGSTGWVYVLAPTPDLWSLVLRHRTQILYIADISMVCTYLELAPGCVVLESGTGSGSLTHSLVRAVAPTGHVHTFEFHPERASEAAKEFKAHGLTPCVTVRQRDIEQKGFPHGSADEPADMIDLTSAADAVFLDLPAPYKAIPSAATCLKPNGRICSFSPCIEQVQATCEALECNGFTDIQTLECLLRVHDVRTEKLTRVTGSTVQSPPADKSDKVGQKRPREEEGQETLDTGTQEGANEEGHHQQQPSDAPQAESQQADSTTAQPATATRQGTSCIKGNDVALFEMVVTSKPALDARGHTGYLTFARKFVCGGEPLKTKPTTQAAKPDNATAEGDSNQQVQAKNETAAAETASVDAA